MDQWFLARPTSARISPKRAYQGFSLIEAIVVVALVAILASLAAPMFTGAIANQRVRSAAQELQTLLQFARAEAVYKRKQITVVPSASQKWQARDSIAVLREVALPEVVSVEPVSDNGVVFSVEGQAKPVSGTAPYKISISATNASRMQCLSVIGTGLVRLESIASGQTCS
ncbi:GspH/FimT family pseudopilin [Variovorax sp. CY25R-8]|uniref:GspH/FimT family pseudopilin n=1 Tax=Variovorax sp. CY25R-8 TaxID=2855501 RepID=UPI0021BA5056|nr:GspH/FimT family pseudopilin [Variovorax sp. CY25R-8]